ncbi:MAG: FMN-dependent NADH-azoreductase [Arenicella sp.]
MPKILTITSSAREQESISSQLSMIAAQEVEEYFYEAQIIHRDLNNSDISLITSQWIDAYFTPKLQRNPGQIASLRKSDLLINELKSCHALVIGMPVYNFGMPASLKAYCDLICRAGSTFRQTDNGTTGLLADRPTFIVVTSGTVSINSATDFATPHLIKILNFLGIHDIQIVDATRLQSKDVGNRIAGATYKIQEYVYQRFGEPETETA